MPEFIKKNHKQLTGKRFTKNDMILFGEMIAHEAISETDVAVYFKSMYERKEA